MARGFEVTTGLVIQQGLFEISASANHNVGTRMQLADGRVFYMCLAGGNLTPGKMALTPLGLTAMDAQALTTVAANAKSVTITPTGSPTIAANDFAEGYFYVATGTTGAGQMAKIKSHGSSASNADVVLTLYDPLPLGISADGTGGTIRNPFRGVTHLANNTGAAAGIPLVSITSAYYGWLQTWGTAPALAGGTGTVGMELTVATTAGEVIVVTCDTTAKYNGLPMHVGYAAGITVTDAAYMPIMLKLYP